MKNLLGRRRNLPVVSILFFIAIYLLLQLLIKTELVYHHFEITNRQPSFKTGWVFLQDYLSYPGGLSQYIASFLTQLLHYRWTGALCITLISCGIFYLVFNFSYSGWGAC